VRTTHARTSPATPAARRGITGVVGMCLAESLRGLGGVYPDTAKVASHARAVGTWRTQSETRWPASGSTSH